MRQLVESLKRLYDDQKISKGKIIKMSEDKLLSVEERKYILGEAE